MSLPSLINRTNYSFLYSALTIEEIIGYAVRNRHTHVVISDLQNSHAWYKFFREAVKNNLIPVFGIQTNYNNSAILFLAKNLKGYQELLKISKTKSPIGIDYENLIFIHLEGEDNFPHLAKYFANRDQPKGVYVRENKFSNANDFEFFCLLRAIDSGTTTIESEQQISSIYKRDYLEFRVNPELENSIQAKNLHHILSQCERYDICPNQDTLTFSNSSAQRLKDLANNLFVRLSTSLDPTQVPKYKERLLQELQVLIDKNFCEYFLIVHDAVSWAKSQGIYIGPGRGSVCGSLVAYVLAITEIDPIKYDLYFERFLNVTRKTIPDIDIDIASDRRNDLFKYLREKYGEDHVALIAIYRTFKYKNSIREIFRAHEIPASESEYYLRLVKKEDEREIKAAVSKIESRYFKLAKQLEKIQDYPQNVSVHASGIIISSIPLSSCIPMDSSSRFALNVTQWEFEDLEEMGFIKFDFLASHSLYILGRMEQRIGELKGSPLDWKTIDLEDKRVYETLINGFNAFIFQFENPKLRPLIRKYRPSCILDLALITSVHRPGASNQIPDLIERRNLMASGGKISIENALFTLLEETYGLLIYQEQLMKMVSEATKCSFGDSDTFRRVIREDPSKTEKLRKWFFDNSRTRYSKKDLEEAWDCIVKFANYGFNKSHAVAYSILSYRFLWIKTHHPEIFYSESLLNSFNVNCFSEMEAMGYSVMPPTYGKSDYSRFKLIGTHFYFPISKILGIELTRETYESLNFNRKDFKSAVKGLVENKISLNNIRLLLRVGFFEPLISSSENIAYYDQNLDVIWNNYALGMNLDLKELDQSHTYEHKKHQRELLGLDFEVNRIPERIFQQHPTLKKINTLMLQGVDSSHKYIGFVASLEPLKNFQGDLSLRLKISDGFYLSPAMFFEGSPAEVSKWKEDLKPGTPIIVEIQRPRENEYRIFKVKIIK